MERLDDGSRKAGLNDGNRRAGLDDGNRRAGLEADTTRRRSKLSVAELCCSAIFHMAALHLLWGREPVTGTKYYQVFPCLEIPGKQLDKGNSE